MRFSTKLILICETVFILLTIIIGSIIGSMAYEKTRQSAIDSYIYEADNIVNNINLYLANVLTDQKPVKDYAASIVDLFSKEDVSIEVYDTNLQRLSGTIEQVNVENRKELAAALKNKGQQIFMSRHVDDGRYLAFFSQYIERDNEGVLIAITKDISALDAQKSSIFLFVVRGLIIGVVLVAFVIWAVTSYLMRPVVSLNRAARRISVGDYSERVKVESDDEFGQLAESFNIMATAVEDNIAELEERYEAQQQMMDNLTHELRTPLTSIIGYAELLQKIPYKEDVFKKGLGYINSEGKRMLNLNKTLLDLTYYRHDKSVFEKADILPLLYEIQDLIGFRAQEKGVDVIVQGESLILDMAPELIRSLLTNLVDNALKACSAGDKIFLSAVQNENFCTLSVRDTGKGMTKEQLNHITEPFYQVERARSRTGDDPFAGLGLGLAIVEQITRNHNGEIRFISALGEGTEVLVDLPLEQK